MPYVEQSRTIKVYDRFESATVNNVNASIDYLNTLTWQDLLQTTYSFRGNSQEEDDTEILSGKNFGSTLRNQYSRRYDTGHDFYTYKSYFHISDPDLTITGRKPSSPFSIAKLKHANVYPSWITSQRPAVVGNMVSDATLDFYGRKYISETIPTQSEASLAVFLGELREKLPKVIGAGLLKHGRKPGGLAKGAADEHLNIQFGLKPFANDLAKMAAQVVEFHKIVKDFQRNSEKIIRRKRQGDTQRTATQLALDVNQPRLHLPRINAITVDSWFFKNPDVSGASTDKVSVWSTVDQTYSFSAAYSYYLSEADDFLGKLENYEQLANHLLGSRITPETVWELTPWSWLVDWHIDAGRFFKNVSLLHSDSTVLRYGYIMCETRTEWTKYVMNIAPQTGATVPSMCSSSFVVHSKQRRRATPYGFGLNPASMTGRQWSILGALGMTRGPRSMRGAG